MACLHRRAKGTVYAKGGGRFSRSGLRSLDGMVATKKRIDDAQLRWFDPARASRVSLICGSARNDGTCPGEMSKTFRLLQLAREVLEEADIFPDVPDLSLLTSECGRNIFRAKGAHRPRCRCAIGRAVAIPITHSTRPTTEWPRFKSAGRQPIP